MNKKEKPNLIELIIWGKLLIPILFFILFLAILYQPAVSGTLPGAQVARTMES